MSTDFNATDQTQAAGQNDDAWLTMLAVLQGTGYVKKESVQKLLDEVREQGEPPPMPVVSARAALDWLIMNGYTDAQAEQAATERLLEQLRTRTVPDYLLPAMPVLERLDPSLSKAIDEHSKHRMRQAKRKLLLSIGGPLVLAGGYVLWTMFPSTPGCDASSTRKTLMLIAVDVGVSAMHDPKILLSGEGPQSIFFTHETEVGYDDDTGTRACTASIETGGKDSGEKAGYVVERVPGSRSDFRVQMLPVEVIMARYTGSALNKKLGAPVGREAMRTAIVAGLRKLDGDAAELAPSYGKSLPGDDPDAEPKTLADSVQEVLPSADCRALDGGRYACPVQIEYRDQLMGAIGAMPYRQLKGEFVFERDGGGWKVADGFDKTFMQSIVNSRFDAIKGKPDAAAPPPQAQ
ncbi:hypothetical protein LMG28688_04894 [Paraburkholderia caffeinitolerans]|uniref:Uncharacterized protein n=2 Tax=Paraburkholderia TaxID=1822464 RepID=A0A6J5GL44_9BURK|nr:hypothetical protein [Paraburkholderia caffeinitolerans]CAB3799234.1 hypothetical protein LMG28688_04894 [Paraburkholderia caffeinitolerans]